MASTAKRNFHTILNFVLFKSMKCTKINTVQKFVTLQYLNQTHGCLLIVWSVEPWGLRPDDAILFFCRRQIGIGWRLSTCAQNGHQRRRVQQLITNVRTDSFVSSLIHLSTNFVSSWSDAKVRKRWSILLKISNEQLKTPPLPTIRTWFEKECW